MPVTVDPHDDALTQTCLVVTEADGTVLHVVEPDWRPGEPVWIGHDRRANGPRSRCAAC